MRKIFLVLFCLLFQSRSFAQTLSGMNDAQTLGTMAGLALACNAGSRLDDFQLIASYILGDSYPLEIDRQKAFKQYASEKLRTYNLQKKKPKEECKDILNHFYNMPIFEVTIYKDGSIKFPDGKILKSPTKADKKKALIKAKKKQDQPKRNYLIPSRSGRQSF